MHSPIHAGDPWCDLAPHGTAEEGQFFINEYFARNPHMMLGHMPHEGTMDRANDPTLVGELTPKLLARAVATLPAGIMTNRQRTGIEHSAEPADVYGGRLFDRARFQRFENRQPFQPRCRRQQHRQLSPWIANLKGPKDPLYARNHAFRRKLASRILGFSGSVRHR